MLCSGRPQLAAIAAAVGLPPDAIRPPVGTQLVRRRLHALTAAAALSLWRIPTAAVRHRGLQLQSPCGESLLQLCAGML